MKNGRGDFKICLTTCTEVSAFWPHKKTLKELSLTDLKVEPFDLALVNHEALDQHVLFIE